MKSGWNPPDFERPIARNGKPYVWNVNVRVLCSDPWIPGIFETTSQWTCSQRQSLYCVMPVWEGATLSQINSLGSIQVRITFCAGYLVTIAFSAATHTHIHWAKLVRIFWGQIKQDHCNILEQVCHVHTFGRWVYTHEKWTNNLPIDVLSRATHLIVLIVSMSEKIGKGTEVKYKSREQRTPSHVSLDKLTIYWLELERQTSLILQQCEGSSQDLRDRTKNHLVQVKCTSCTCKLQWEVTHSIYHI